MGNKTSSAPPVAGPSEKDCVALVLHQQPARGLHQPLVRQLLQPRPLPRGEHAPPRAVGRLLYPLEPQDEATGTRLVSLSSKDSAFLSLCARPNAVVVELQAFKAREVTFKLKLPPLTSKNKSLSSMACKFRAAFQLAGAWLEIATLWDLQELKLLSNL